MVPSSHDLLTCILDQEKAANSKLTNLVVSSINEEYPAGAIALSLSGRRGGSDPSCLFEKALVGADKGKNAAMELVPVACPGA